MRRLYLASIVLLSLSHSRLEAGISISPYVSIRSTKSIDPQKNKKTGEKSEKETIKQHREAGISAGVNFWRLLRFQLGVGQSTLTTTEKTSEIKDEYGKIDLKSELSIPEDEDPEAEVTTTETQRIARASLIVDPSIGFLIIRAKIGATAKQRLFDVTMGDSTSSKDLPPIYAMHSGAGLGIKFSPNFYAIAEYSFEHYAFPPDLEPFERQLSVGFNISI